MARKVLPAETFPADTGRNPDVRDSPPGPSLYSRLHHAGRGLRGGRAGSGSTVENGIFHDTWLTGCQKEHLGHFLAAGLVTQFPASDSALFLIG